jgi:thiosulfate dehydrogenase
LYAACNFTQQHPGRETTAQHDTLETYIPDTHSMPPGKYGEMVRYGRELFLHTAYYIGPDGVNGKYLGNKMNCTNCHQDAGTKPYSFNLVKTQDRYPQYRAREGKVISLAERINNCIVHPHNGKPLPLDSKEMIAMLSYLKWINESVPTEKYMRGEHNPDLQFPDRAADPAKGELLFIQHCQRCHGADGAGLMTPDGVTYLYPPLWGKYGYQHGSSMHRIIKQAQWLKANMPYDSATWNKPMLTDDEALDIAAFVNDDRMHYRPNPKQFEYPNPEEKAIDYDKGPFADPFTEKQHKFGPYKPILSYWKNKGVIPSY